MTAHWGIEDPSLAVSTEIEREQAFVTAMRFPRNRIAVMLALPVGSLDRMALTGKLREIGQLEGTTSCRPEVA